MRLLRTSIFLLFFPVLSANADYNTAHTPRNSQAHCGFASKHIAQEFSWPNQIQTTLRDLNLQAELFLSTRARNYTGFTYIASIRKTLRSNAPEVIELYLMDDETPNAFSLPAHKDEKIPARILITKGLLDSINNDAELAFVIAHEVAHIKFDHFLPEVPFSLMTDRQRKQRNALVKKWELAADKHAGLMLANSGFNPMHAKAILQRLSHLHQHNNENAEISNSHPHVTERVWQITRAY